MGVLVYYESYLFISCVYLFANIFLMVIIVFRKELYNNESLPLVNIVIWSYVHMMLWYYIRIAFDM